MPWSLHQPIVVPFDFSDHSVAAVRQAVKIADAPSQVHVVYVIPFLIPTEPGVVWGTVDDASRLKHATEELEKALPEHEYGNIHRDVRIGDPGQVTVGYAEELNSELIIIGSHGRTGITRLVLGSVAERVTRLSHCPVLVVKLEPEKAPAAEAANGAGTTAPAAS